MKIFIAAQSQETLDIWGRLLPSSPDIRFFLLSDLSEPADALVMSGVWAFDRYGGAPTREAAQILPNTRGDGLPDWIIVPPFRPVAEREGQIEIRDDFKEVSPAYHAISNSLRVAERELGNSCTIILDLLMLGMDNPKDSSTPKSVARAIRDFMANP